MKNYFFILIAGMLILSSCSSITVNFDHDKSVDFTQYKTFEYYGWAENSDRLLTPFEKERLESAFGDEFAKRGIEYVEENADLVVSLFIITEQKTKTTASTSYYGGYGGYYGYGPGWGYGPGYGGGMGYSSTTVSTYDYIVGTLVVDVYDKEKQKLIWESIGSGSIDDNPQKREKNIPKTVALIMVPYPIPPQASK